MSGNVIRPSGLESERLPETGKPVAENVHLLCAYSSKFAA
jgi:hypothetical protein